MTDSTRIPALLGGQPVRPHGPPAWPPADDEVLDALQRAFTSGTWGVYHGPHVAKLEEALAQFHGVAHALTCSSGTLAVEAGLRALQVRAGDEVILAAYDYGGNILGVHALGAKPVLVDVAPSDWNLDPKQLAGAVSRSTRAVVVSHLHGGVVPMAEVMAFAAAHKLAVLEDAAQTPGALIQGRPAGAWGDVGVLSFGGSKLLSSGRGGVLFTNRSDIRQRARIWLNRGNNSLAPLSELQAAVLLPQLTKLEERNRLRAANAAALKTRLAHLPGLRPFVPQTPDAEQGYYKLGWQFDPAIVGLSRDRFAEAVRAEGVALDEGFHAVHVGRSSNRFRPSGTLKNADNAHRNSLVLHHPVLVGSSADLEEAAVAIEKVYANARLISDS